MQLCFKGLHVKCELVVENTPIIRYFSATNILHICDLIVQLQIIYIKQVILSVKLHSLKSQELCYLFLVFDAHQFLGVWKTTGETLRLFRTFLFSWNILEEEKKNYSTVKQNGEYNYCTVFILKQMHYLDDSKYSTWIRLLLVLSTQSHLFSHEMSTGWRAYWWHSRLYCSLFIWAKQSLASLCR